MKERVQIELPVHLVRSRAALDFWQYEGRWDCSGIDWYTICQQRRHPVRTALINGHLSSFVFTEAGELVEIPPATWGGLLWSEAYETTLTNVSLRGRIATGYLCVDRTQLEKLRRVHPADERVDVAARLDADLAGRVATECSTIGLVAKAIAMQVEANSEKTVDTWLRENWPEDLTYAWPGRWVAGRTPSLARQLNVAIRLVPVLPLLWQGAEPADELVFDLKRSFPILAAALEVHRLCQTDALDDRGKVFVVAARKALEQRVGTAPKAGRVGQMMKAVAQLSIPEHKVSGGGRNRSSA